MNKERIISLRKEGKSYKEIQILTGCSKSTISFHCKNENIAGTQNKISDETIDKMRIYRKTHTCKETSVCFNVSIGTVKNYCLVEKSKQTIDERCNSRLYQQDGRSSF